MVVGKRGLRAPSSWLDRAVETMGCQSRRYDDIARFPCLPTGLAMGWVDAAWIIDAVADQAGKIELIAWFVAVQPAMLPVDPAGAAAWAGAKRRISHGNDSALPQVAWKAEENGDAMATPFPQDTAALFDLLSNDALLSSYLGRYTMPDGTQLPAIARLWDNEQLPDGTDIHGVEVVIRRAAAGNTTPGIGAEMVEESTMRLYLMVWRSDELPLAEDALNRIKALLPGLSWQDVTPPQGLGGLAQWAITWRNPAGMVIAAT